MKRLALVIPAFLFLFAAPALADAPASTDAPKAKAEIVRTDSGRQATLERWRGGPRGNRSSDELLRREALDKQLPLPIGFNGIGVF